ncbi:ComEA family DNA-binding protein [Paenibacillus sp. GCM10012307]|uniref:ComEA family DNA-binding protein n=1 Tax=Paenibacillus roseus TaxID=2798579 RepID=A0A934MWE7_9BACL|nr:ComEA family DNA-binding protein [Paenibacillus roseus]MBJ6363072.1 ComEA family DNA-binding protein [Paenibacillus roseus]
MAALLLLIMALWERNGEESEQWLRLDNQLEAALAAYDEPLSKSGPGLIGKADAATNQAVAASGQGLEKASGEEAASTEISPPASSTGDASSSGAVGAASTTTDNSQPERAAQSAPAEPLVDAEGRLNLNKAQAEDLIALPGIGPAKAQAIVDDRKRNGPFRSVEDIIRVKGIGSKMLEKIKNSIVVYPGL